MTDAVENIVYAIAGLGVAEPAEPAISTTNRAAVRRCGRRPTLFEKLI